MPPAADIPAATTKSTHTCGSSSMRVADQHQREHEQHRVGEQHEPAAVVRVRQGAAEQRGGEQRHELGEPEQADDERRVRQLVDLERDRDERDHRARERDALADEQQPEVAVASERAEVEREGAEQTAHDAPAYEPGRSGRGPGSLRPR